MALVGVGVFLNGVKIDSIGVLSLLVAYLPLLILFLFLLSSFGGDRKTVTLVVLF